MIKDAVFGEIEYDSSWHRRIRVSFNNEDTDIMLTIYGDEDADFEEEQYIAYRALMDSWSGIHMKLLEPILEYYTKERIESGYDIEDNEDYPQIDTVAQLLEHIKLVGIIVPYAEMYGDDARNIGVSFSCSSWDSENGIGLCLLNEQVYEVGAQDIVF